MKTSFYALALAGLIGGATFGGCASPDAAGTSPTDLTSEKSLPKRAMDRGSDIEVDSNINQINQALMMIKQEGNGAPATLEEAKKAAKVPDSMWTDTVSGRPLVYDAATGTAHREGVAPGAPPSAGTSNAPAGVNIPGGGGY